MSSIGIKSGLKSGVIECRAEVFLSSMMWVVLFVAALVQSDAYSHQHVLEKGIEKSSDPCTDFNSGKNWSECLENCRAASCDFIYREGSSWCASFCMSQSDASHSFSDYEVGC